MADKKNNTTIIIVVGIVTLILFALFVLPHSAPTSKNFIEVRLYDANGNLLGTTENFGSSSWFSIVNGIPGVASIDITVTVQNTGTTPLSCSLGTLTPTQFNSAMTKTTKNVLPGNSVGWTTSLISVAQFEAAPTPDVFTAPVTCTYVNTQGQTVTVGPKSGTLSLTISAEGTQTGSFDVTLNPGGLGTEWCGDGICQISETFSSCPTDCTVANNVKFRTTDASYVSGSAIAYNSTGNCGTIASLTAYGWRTSGNFGSICSASMSIVSGCGTSSVLIMSNLPGGWRTGGASPSLWKPTESGIVCVCDDDGIAAQYRKYDTTSSNAAQISTSITSINSALEVAC